MKSIKLGESKRQDILTSIMDAWTENNPEPKVDIAHKAALMAYYNMAYSEELRKKLNSPEIRKFLNMHDRFLVQVEGVMEQFRLDEGTLPLPSSDHHRGVCILVVEKACPEHVYVQELEREHDAWMEQRRTLQREAHEILNIAGSTTQLLEIWPELEPLLPAYLANPSQGVKLPSIPVSRLNERLGL
jgi:hypothetical protein